MIKVSFRNQILLAIISILAITITLYLSLATSLFGRDRLAYSYELASTVARAKAEEIAVVLNMHVQRGTMIGVFSKASMRQEHDAKERAVVDELLRDTSILAVDIWDRSKTPARRVADYFHGAVGESLRLTRADFEDIRQTEPQRGDIVLTKDVRVFNVSLPPDIPLLAVAAAHDKHVIVTYLSPDALMRLMATSELYSTYLVDALGTVLVHSDRDSMLNRDRLGARVVSELSTRNVSHWVLETATDIGPVLTAGSRIALGRLIVISEISKQAALKAVGDLQKRSLFFGGAVFFAVLLLGVFISHRLGNPIRDLEHATQKLARGDMRVTVPVRSSSEIGRLANSFNEMAKQLALRDTQLRKAYMELQQKEHLSLLSILAEGIVQQAPQPLQRLKDGYHTMKDHLTRLRESIAQSQTMLSDSDESIAKALTAADALSERLRDDAGKVETAIESMRVLARKEDDKLCPVDIHQPLNAVIELLTAKIQTRATLVKNFSNVHPVTAGETQLGHIFLTLVNFALHGIPAGAPERNELRISTHTDQDNTITIEIADSGVGLSENAVAGLFDPFYPNFGDEAGGGLGLAICYNSVVKLGGAIDVRSEVGAGTSITVSLPHSAEVTYFEPSKTKKTAPEKQKSILVVDDSRAVRRTLKRTLGRTFMLELAESGAEGLQLLKNGHEYDLILCDLVMPEMGGVEYLHSVAEHHAASASKVVFMTAYAFSPEIQQKLADLPNRVIEKPVTVQQIETILQDISYRAGLSESA